MKFKLLFILLSFLLVLSSCDKNENDDITEVNDGESTETPMVYPSTYIIVNTDTMWMVSKTQLNDPNKYRYQINFGTNDQLQQNVDEVGQNSTLAISLSFSEKPLNSGTFNYTSSRFDIDNTQVNFYVSFFNNTGYTIVNENYLTPDEGELVLTLSDSNVNATIQSLVLSDEVDTTKTITLKGVFDFEW